MSALRAAAPRDVAALKALLAGAPAAPRFIAGGSDLLLAPRATAADGLLIDISRTIGLSYVAIDADALSIGAATTFAELERNPDVRRALPALAEAAALSGSAQIRNRATLGGNVANASPAGDLLPVLKCADAVFTVLGLSGRERRVEFDALLVGAGETSLSPGELILEARAPLAGRLPRSAFVKLGRRQDLTISRLSLAMEADYDAADRRFGRVKLVAGAIAPTPTRLPLAEAALEGRSLSASVVRAFLEALPASIDAAIAGRASRPYKRRAAMGLGLDLIERICGLGEGDALDGSSPP